MKQVSPKIYTSDFSLLAIYNIHYKGTCSNGGSGMWWVTNPTQIRAKLQSDIKSGTNEHKG